jgi:hypothetical protein
LEWLDAWKAPKWLSVDPDQVAWEALREVMLEAYGHPLHVWRQLLDSDDSNCISWLEFQRACKKLHFDGNVAGAWRYLDADLSGLISMKEFDPKSADILNSFKGWAESNYGSVELAFKAIDIDQSNTLTCGELRRACQRLRWTGDPRLLFNCLDIERRRDRQGAHVGKRCLSLAEIIFVDSWQASEQAEEAGPLDDGNPRCKLSTAPGRRHLRCPSDPEAAPVLPLPGAPPATAPAAKATRSLAADETAGDAEGDGGAARRLPGSRSRAARKEEEVRCWNRQLAFGRPVTEARLWTEECRAHPRQLPKSGGGAGLGWVVAARRSNRAAGTSESDARLLRTYGAGFRPSPQHRPTVALPQLDVGAPREAHVLRPRGMGARSRSSPCGRMCMLAHTSPCVT